MAGAALLTLVCAYIVSKMSVRGVLIGCLDVFRRANLLYLRLRGMTTDDVAVQKLVSGKAWEDFCDTLKAAGASLSFPGAPRDGFNLAEGHRYLTRLTRAGLMAFVEYADPKNPILHRVVHETVKMGSDNPDNHYLTACISGKYDYVISGKRNTVKYLSFGTQVGHYGKGGGLPPSGYLEASDLVIDSDDRFAIWVGCEKNGEYKNWLPMQPESGCLIVRPTFGDRKTEILCELNIRREGGETGPSQVTPQMMVDGLESTSTLVAGASFLFAKWARDWQSHSNLLPEFDQATSNAAGGDPNITYYHSHWALKPDEALVIEVLPVDCEHWNFQLNNYWMESLDYSNFRIHTNKYIAEYEEDESVRLVVAHEDPKMKNWIHTTGHECGTMCFRWVRAKVKRQPSARVV
eukprot:gene12850-19806_t